jgi:hypothetical protein
MLNNSQMIEEFIVSRIEASQDGSPYVNVSFIDQTAAERQQSMNLFGVKTMTFTSAEELMKNLPRVMSNVMGRGTGLDDSPTFKLSIREYEDIGLRVGDKVLFEIKKSEATDI